MSHTKECDRKISLPTHFQFIATVFFVSSHLACIKVNRLLVCDCNLFLMGKHQVVIGLTPQNVIRVETFLEIKK